MSTIKFEYPQNNRFSKDKERDINNILIDLLDQLPLKGLCIFIRPNNRSSNQYSTILDDLEIKKFTIEIHFDYLPENLKSKLNHELLHIKDVLSKEFMFNLQKYKNGMRSIVMSRTIIAFWDIKIIDKDNPNYDRIKSYKLKNITKLFDMKKKDPTKMMDILKKVDFEKLNFPQIYNLAKEIKIILQE